jgi:hypothetical protein
VIHRNQERPKQNNARKEQKTLVPNEVLPNMNVCFIERERSRERE